jgi:hypothetical protein
LARILRWVGGQVNEAEYVGGFEADGWRNIAIAQAMPAGGFSQDGNCAASFVFFRCFWFHGNLC